MTEIILPKPGAGLPFLESLYVRFYVGPFQSRKADKSKNLRLFQMVGARLLKEFSSIPAEKRDTKVLVPRMPGIEDSSRNWCPNQVLEHLMITGVPMRGLIVELANGRTSDYEVKIENFKPQGKYEGGDASQDFKKFLDETVSILDTLDVKDAGPTHKHPWLGQFNALQWTWLLAGHNGLHYNQLQAIKKGL
ncbi:MAG: DinB family protein [Elusimicrobiota bacterium]|nr:MAG: DinB family protein [Elusimicrobiota bacterium]